MSNIRSTILSLAVPLSCNTPQNKLCLSFEVNSDITICRVSFYEHDGVYWFCLEHDKNINSVGFVSLLNCASALRDTLNALGFVFHDYDSLKDYVRRWEHSIKFSSFRKGVA